MKTRVQKLYNKVLDRMCRKQYRRNLVTSALVGALVLASAVALGAYAFRGAIFYAEAPGPEASAAQGETSEDVPFRHPLTGVPSDEEVERPQVYAVVIDHAPDAWPQAGVDDAFLVIEAPVEAGIPRLMAFFTEEQEVAKIGPVRSARPYFVEWANELDALFAHVGGSPEALDLIATGGTFDLNQFANGSAYWRSTDRFAPHNVFTSSKRLGEALDKARDRDRDSEKVYGTWKFDDGGMETADGPSDISVAFSSGTYRADWEYLPEEGRYLRTQGGRTFRTDGGSEILADNIAVVVTDISVIDAVGRRRIRTLGEGTAFVAQGGRTLKGTWKKDAVSTRLRFFDEDGEEIPMRPGTTWIEVIDDEEKVSR